MDPGLQEPEDFEESADRLHTGSLVSHGLAMADREGCPDGVDAGSQIRVCGVKPDVGVGRKSRADTCTFVELGLALLPDDKADTKSVA